MRAPLVSRGTPGELRLALAHAARALAGRGVAGALAAAPDDPLRLDLPPLHAGSATLSPAVVRVLGALYLQSELEQAGVIAGAELLARSRDGLPLRGTGATRLEGLAAAMRGRATESYDRARRQALFARLFGTGAAAAPGDAAAVNHGFEQQLAALCGALSRAEAAYRWRPTPDATSDAGVRHAATLLLSDLGARHWGATTAAARAIDAQLRQAIAVLGDPEVGAMFGARGMWAVLRWLHGEQAPDMGRHAARGPAGQALLHWLADALPLLAREGSAIAAPGSPAFLAAARWLTATGVAAAPVAAAPVAAGPTMPAAAPTAGTAAWSR